MLNIEALQSPQLGPVNLAVQAGELVQITGASGAGKTVLLRMLADLDPNSGRVVLADEERGAMSAPQWRRRVAWLPAESAWWGESVREHFSRADAPDLPDWFTRLGLEPTAIDWQVERLSSGEKQRLAFLRAIQLEPRVLLLDEPTANLDLANTRRLERAVRGYLADADACALWVSHDDQQRNRLGGRIFDIRDQRLHERAPA